MRIVDRLVARDPDAAFAHIQSLMAQTQDLEARYELRDWLAHNRLRAGHPEAAVAGWGELHAEAASRSLPLPEPTAPDRKSVVEGKGVSVRVDLGGRGILKKNERSKHTHDIYAQ